MHVQNKNQGVNNLLKVALLGANAVKHFSPNKIENYLRLHIKSRELRDKLFTITYRGNLLGADTYKP